MRSAMPANRTYVLYPSERMAARLQTLLGARGAGSALASSAAGCGGSERRRLRRRAPRLREGAGRARRRRSPPSTSRANELLGGGTDAFEKRIAALRGYPVVVNVWASWCGPCRFEFPILQQLSAQLRQAGRLPRRQLRRLRRRRRAPSSREAPVPYPSYTDPDEDIADSARRQRRPPRHRLLRPHGRARLPQAGPLPRAKPNWRPTSAATRCESG